MHSRGNVIVMTTTLDVQILRVFTGPDAGHGNELGVVFDAAELPGDVGVRLTARLGFSETVFVDDEKSAAFRIFTPTVELKLAGHPTVGTAWVLGRRAGSVPETLRPRLSSPVTAWSADGLTWIRAAVADAKRWEFVQLPDPAQVDALAVAPGPEVAPSDPLAQRMHHEFWAWLDDEAGEVRARAFCREFDIPEDEATGSAAIHLTYLLGRALTIRQGRGSVIRTRPAEEPGWIEIGGAVTDDGFRTVTL